MDNPVTQLLAVLDLLYLRFDILEVVHQVLEPTCDIPDVDGALMQ